MEPQVSKYGFPISNTKKGQVLYPECTKFHKYIIKKFKGCKIDSTQFCVGKYGMKSCKASHIYMSTMSFLKTS